MGIPHSCLLLFLVVALGISRAAPLPLESSLLVARGMLDEKPLPPNPKAKAHFEKARDWKEKGGFRRKIAWWPYLLGVREEQRAQRKRHKRRPSKPLSVI